MAVRLVDAGWGKELSDALLASQNYDLLVKNISAACLHAISKLYP